MVNRSRLVEEFCSFVTIDSVSFRERELADTLKRKLEDLGFEIYEDEAGGHYSGNCGNVYGFLEGQLDGDPILLSAHMDTVEPGLHKKPMLHEDGKITSDGSTVLGADDISGIVAILEAIRVVKERGILHRDIEVLFTIAEEAYIRGSEVFDFTRIKSKEAYVLDLSGRVGSAALAAPTLISFTEKITGKASHAGFDPEHGINAIAIMADAIGKVKQGKIDEDTTLNIGMITGGKARNIISDMCTVNGEIRSMDHDKALSQMKKLEEIFNETAKTLGGISEFTYEFGCISYHVEENHHVVRRFQQVCNKLKYESYLTTTFGGSDNNNFLRNGIIGIVLACGMNQVHSTSEYTSTDELVKTSNIVIELITDQDF